MLHDQKIFLVTQIDPEVENPDVSGVYRVGTIGYYQAGSEASPGYSESSGGGHRQGSSGGFSAGFPLSHRCDITCERGGDPVTGYSDRAMYRSLKELFHRYCMENGKISKELVSQILNIEAWKS